MNIKPMLVSTKVAKALLGVGNTKFHEFTKLEEFPPARYPNGKAPMYVVEELEIWIATLQAY